jgi:putative aminopeptidase FrvX
MTKMTDEHLDLLKRVSETRGISGHEKRVAKLVRSELENVVDTIEYDNLGSIVTTLNGAKDEPKVLIAAHMDEIGFLVQKN